MMPSYSPLSAVVATCVVTVPLALLLVLGWMKRLFLRPVRDMDHALSALDDGTLTPDVLAGPAAREDELGRLARTLQRLAHADQVREQGMRAQIQALNTVIEDMRRQMQDMHIEMESMHEQMEAQEIMIDEMKKARQVAEIIESDQFRAIRAQARRLRAERAV